MGKRIVADLFCEDSAHEALLRPLVRRVGREERADTLVQVRAARGGHPRALKEFDLYQRAASRMEGPVADILIVAIDGNCSSFGAARERVIGATSASNRYRLVVASPDPHVERWYLSDPEAVAAVTGHDPGSMRAQASRDYSCRRQSAHARGSGDCRRPGQGDGPVQGWEERFVARRLCRRPEDKVSPGIASRKSECAAVRLMRTHPVFRGKKSKVAASGLPA